MQLWVLGAAVVLIGCGGPPHVPAPTLPATPPAASTSPVASSVARSAPTPAPALVGAPTPATANRSAVPVEVRLRIERRTDDVATRRFAEVVAATLADPRGWTRAGFRIVVDPSAAYAVILGEAAEVDELSAVASWLDARAGRVDVLRCDGGLSWPATRIPRFDPVHNHRWRAS